MGRFLLGQKEAAVSYEVEELDLRLYTAEELCYYIYHYLPLVSDDFVDGRLRSFIRDGLGMKEMADKLDRFYVSPSDLDSTLLMILLDVGYYTDSEIAEFQNQLLKRKKKNGPERLFEKAAALSRMGRCQGAVRICHELLSREGDARITPEFRDRIHDLMADAYGCLGAYPEAVRSLSKEYESTQSEALLRKMQRISLFSGIELPEEIAKRIPDAKYAEWEKEYRDLEEQEKRAVDNEEVLTVFFLDEEAGRAELKNYIDDRKQKLRGMLD